MKKIFSITFGFVAAMSMAVAFCFAGCASLFSFNGKFSKDEIVLSVGDEILAGDYFSSEKSVEFFTADESVLAKNDTGTFSALRSGKTSLTAKSGDLIIDSVKVYVKYDFQKPTNVNVTNDGLVSWDSSALMLDGRLTKPTYKILLNGTEYDAPTNEYQLTQSGTYTIKVRASATSRVNGSVYSDEITISYDTVEGASRLQFVSDPNFGSQTGVLSWVGGEDGVLTIDNIQQNVSGNEKLLNLSSYTEKSVIDAKLYLKSGDNNSKTQTKTITKLYTQEPSIKNDEIYWHASNSVKCTLIKAKNVATGAEEIVRVTSNISVLEGLDEGIYTIANQAIAQEGFANGNVKDFAYQVGKVANVDAICSLEGSTLRVTFSTASEYNKKFAVKQNGVVSQFEFVGEKVGGKYTLTHDFELDGGLNIFTVQAYPTLGESEFEFGGSATKLAIKSDEEKIFSAYNLGEISSVAHTTDDDGNSILTFDNIEYANSFEVSINNVVIAEKLVSIGDSQTTINIGKITKAKYGNTQQFVVEIKATRAPAANEIVKPSIIYKNLTMLSKPVMSDCAGGQNTGNSIRYSWQKDANANYVYELYLTDETFDTTDVVPFTESVSDAKTKTLTAGYYVVKVRALPIDKNSYLESEEIGQDRFYFTEQIASPQIRLDYTSELSSEYSGYVISIKTVEFGYEYKVLFGESETNLGSVFATGELDELAFNLPSTAILDGTKQIKVVAIANGTALQAIHSNGTSILTVEKLARPTEYSIIENDSKIEVANGDSQAIIQLYKNGTMISQSDAGKNAVADISSYDGEFAVQARYVGYDEFDGYTTNGTTKINSDFAAFTLHRSQTPFNLFYNSGTVGFEHSDQAEKYIVSIEVESTNGTAQKTFEPEITSNETTPTKKSFNLESEIAELRSSDEQFNSIFTQRTKITLSLYAYISQKIEGKYYLPSFDAIAKHDGEQQIVISKLDPVVLEYNYDEKVIYWDGDENLSPVYDVYLDNAFKATISTKSASDKYEYDISAYDFSVAGEYKFYIIASSDNALASDKSKNIVIRKIAQVEKLDVIEKTDGYYAKFAFAAGDEGHIDDVIVNDESIGVNTEFKLTSDTTSIVIKGENYTDASGDKIYYISSEKSNFTISQLQLNDFAANVNIESEKISWQDYAAANADTWSLTTPESSLRYLVEIYSASTLKTKVANISTNSLNLDNQNLLNLAKGEYTLKLYAYISEYEIANGGSGYYGKVLLQDSVSIKKLAQVEDVFVSMNDVAGTIENELSKDIVLSWQHSGIGTSEISYKIFINDSLAATTTANTYTFSQADFGKAENTISIVAVSDTDIASNRTDIKLYKYAQPEISIDDRGMLTITDKDVPAVASGYIIEVTMLDGEGNAQTDEYYTTSRKYDLNQIGAGINERSGEINVRVIQRVCHTSVNAIPTIAAETTKTVLATPTIAQTASGFTILSTDDGVDFYVKCEAKHYDKKVTGSTFVYPDEWATGEYEFIVYAQRSDAIDSWKNEPITVDVDRVTTASSVKFTLAENYLDYTLSWDSITSASGYEIEVFANNVKIGNTLSVDSASAKLSQIREVASAFKSGVYVLSLRSMANFTETAKTNSTPFMFTVTVAENTVDNVEINEDGKLSFTSNNKESFYIVTKQTDSEEEFGELVEASTNEYTIPKYAGKLQISIVQINTSTSEQTATSASGVSINAAAVVANVTKLQDILSVVKNQNNGKITINVTSEADEANRKFVVSYKGVEKNLNVVKNGSSYEFLAIDMVNLFGEVTDGDFDYLIISLIEGNARSNAFEDQIGYSNHNNSSSAVKQDEVNDYIILTGDLIESATASATAIHITANEKTYCEAPVFGYWIENNNSGVDAPKYFSSTDLTGTNIISVRCCAINISDLLDNADAGRVNVKVGFVSTNDGLFTITNYSEVYEYKKLKAVTMLNIEDGNFKWSNTGEENTGFMLYFDGDTQHKTAKVSANSATYYLGENVAMTEEFSASIKVVSSELKVVPSKKTKYKSQGVDAKISQLSQVESDMNLINGVIKLEFNTSVGGKAVAGSEKVEKKYPSIEAMLANRTSSSDFPTITNFAEQLISNRLTQPFSFRLENLEDVEFNLKFVEKVATNGIKKSYYTSVRATNILSALQQETLAEIYTAFNDNNITNETIKAKLDTVYKMLTNSDYFTGVASSSLLFREIGQNETGEYGFYPASAIPVGEYDIYIQQIGSAADNTISSQYKLAKSGAKVVNSPITRTASEAIDGGETNVYYAKFAPISGKTDYTIALRDKITGEIIEYKVSKPGDDYAIEMFSGETKTLRFEGGFVWVALNGENGLIYDTNVTNIRGNNIVVKESKRTNGSDTYTQIRNGRKFGGTDGTFTIDTQSYTYTIANGNVSIVGVEVENNEFKIGDIVYSIIPIGLDGHDFTVDIYANGDSQNINGKSETISVTFLKFNIDSLRLKDGRFIWQNFVINSKIYPSTVVAKQANTEATVPTQVIAAQGSTASFSPKSEGAYDYFKFFTKGEAVGFEIKVDSDVYVIENLYKLKSPKIEVVSGALTITDNTSNLDKRESKNFILSNDVSEKTSNIDTQTLVIDGITKNSSNKFTLNWKTGLNGLAEDKSSGIDVVYNYRKTEQKATRFDAAISGDDIANEDFVISGTNIGTNGGYYSVTVLNRDDENPILLQSEKANVEAAKLAYEGETPAVEIEDGNIKWSLSQQSIDEDTLPSITNRAEGDLEVLYEITIDYYYETSSSWNKHSSTTIYSNSNSLSAENIVDPVSGVEFKYVISIRANVYAYTLGSADATTIDNIKYKRITNKTYANEDYFNTSATGKLILDGELLTLGSENKDQSGNITVDGLVGRTKQIENFKIASGENDNSGKLTWEFNEVQATDVMFKVYAINNASKTELNGTVSESNGKYVFDIEKEQLSIDLRYNFEILAYKKTTNGEEGTLAQAAGESQEVGEISSIATRLRSQEDVRMLPNIEASDYEVKEKLNNITNSQENVISFNEYFTKYGTEYDNIMIIKAENEYLGEDEEYAIDNVSAGEFKISVRAVPSAGEKYLMSDSAYEITLEEIEWSDYDDYYYDETAHTISWTFGTEHAYKTCNSEGAEIYISTKENNETIIYPFGVHAGESISAGSLMLLIDYYDENDTKVDGAYVYASQVDVSNGKVVAKENQTVAVYVGTGLLTGEQLESGKEYDMSQKSFKVKNTNPATGEEKDYYIPANVVSFGDKGAYAAQDCSYYIDETCETKDLIEKDTAIVGITAWNANSEYNFVGETDTSGTGINGYYLKTEDVLRYARQKENDNINLDDVTFKVSFTTTYKYNAGGAEYQITDSREYNNVPIGDASSEMLNGIALEDVRVTKFEFPVAGKITKIKIRARKSENNLASDALKDSELGAKSVDMNLFDLGDGTPSSPYIISTKAQFENIKYRLDKPAYLLNYYRDKTTKKTLRGSTTTTIEQKNIKETGTTYCFKQDKDIAIDVSGFTISQTFNGTYDGNGKTMTVSVKGIENLAESEYVTTALPVSSGYENDQVFKKGAGLFKTVGENGTIKNLKLNFSTVVNSQFSQAIVASRAAENDTGKALVGGLVFKNLGLVDSITVVSSSVTFGSALQQSGALAVAPVIGENRKNANGLVSEADVAITNENKAGSQHFYYGGIVGFHNAGTVQLARSKNASGSSGNINVTFASNQNGTVAVGGIAITATSILDMAINTKNISVQANGANTFAGGIIALAVGANLYSCVNTADVSAANAGGIAYAFYTANVNTLVGFGTVNNKVQNLFAKTMSFASSSTSGKYVYSYSTYKPTGSFNLVTISKNENIACYNHTADYKIVVTVANNAYSADIVQIK